MSLKKLPQFVALLFLSKDDNNLKTYLLNSRDNSLICNCTAIFRIYFKCAYNPSFPLVFPVKYWDNNLMKSYKKNLNISQVCVCSYV